MTKKIYLTVLALLMATFGLVAQNPQVKIGNVTAGPGEILVPLEMTGFTAPVNSFTFKITANSSLLQFVELTNKVGFTGPNYQAYQNGNTLSIVYFDIGPGYQPNGKIFDMKFNYTGAANTTLTFQSTGNEVTSGIFPVTNVAYINGTITTTQPIPDPVVKVANVVAAPGAINVPVEMLNFTQNINSLTFKIDIPNNLLQYVDLQNIDPGFNAGTWQAFHTGNMLNIQWFTTGSGFTPSGNVFDIRLNYLGGFNTELTWAPGNEVTYGSTPVANISYIKGSVTQVPSVGTITVGSSNAVSGSTVSLPVTFSGSGLNGVSAFTLFMQYDASKLVFTGTSNSVSPDLIVNQSAGTINMAWQGAPQNFSSATIINLNFIYNGIAPAHLSFLPGSEVNNASANPLPVSYVNGVVSPQASNSVLKIADVSGFAGQTVNVPVNATEIGTVGALDLIINFDNTKATLASYTTNQLSGWVVNQTASQIYLQWQNIAGATVNDGALLTLHFQYHGGGTLPIVFGNGTEVTGTNGLPKAVNFNNGSIAQDFSNSQAVIGTVVNCAQNTAVVPVSLNNIGLVTSFTFPIGFSTSVLTYVELQNVNPLLTGLQVNQTGNVVNIAWESTTPRNLDGKLFDMVFSYLGMVSPVTFNAGSEITGVGATLLPVTFVNGSVDCNVDSRVLTLNVTGNGSVVVKDGSTILNPDANTTNQYTVFYGKVLTLEATGDLGWQFVNWTGAVTNVNSSVTNVNMINNLTVSANFTMIDYTLTLNVNPAAGGTVTGAGVYNFGNMVSVDATPNTGYAFVNWTNLAGDVVSTQPANVIPMPASDLTLIANFALIDYTLTLNVNPAAGGTVTGAGVYNFGNMVSVDATPNTGYAFVNWTNLAGDVVSTQPANVIPMPASDLTLIANFALIDYTLTLNVNPAAGGTVTGAGTYNFGAQVSVNAIPNTGYAFVNWTNLAGDVVSTQPANVIPMPASNLTLIANFALVDYTLTLNVNPTAGGTVTGAGTYNFGAQVSVNAIPNTGYAFVNWTNLAGDVVSTQPANVIPMPASNLTLIANFALIDYTLTLNVNPAAGGTVTGAGTYNFGAQVSVNAIPNSGYAFVNWTNLAGDVVSTQPANVIPMPASDLTLTANFVLAYVAPFPFVENFTAETFPPEYWSRYRQGTGATVREWVRSTAQNHTTGGGGSAFHNYGPASQTEDGWLVTPKIAIPNITNDVELRFWSYNTFPTYYGKNSVLISTTDGTPGAAFTEVWTVASVPNPAAWVENVVDLSAFKGQQIYIAFRYEGSDAHGWYLDDVSVDRVVYVAPIPFVENFTAEAFPPQHWSRYRQGTGATVREWIRSTAQNHTTGGGGSAFHNYGPAAQTEDGWLITPKINIPTGGNDVELRFWNYNTFPTYYGKNSVLISTTSELPGAAFTEVWTVASVPNPAAWAETIVNLNAYKGQQIYIAFRYEGSDAHGWYLDDVTVDYAPANNPMIAVNPASLTHTLEVGQTGSKTVTVTNTGNAPLIYTLNVNQASAAYSIFDQLHNVKPEPVINGQIGVAEQDLSGGTEGTSPMGVKFNEGTGRGILFDNGPFVNAPGAGPGGSDLSQLHSGMTTFGPSINHAGSIRVADDFTVTDTWNVESFTFYAYQTATHPNPPVSSITGAYMKIWSGMPDAAGSVVVYGDMTVNALTSTAWTNAYRVSATTPTNTQRPIMSIVCATPGLTLQPGTYYVEWSATGSIASGPWGVPVTINGETNTGNALQYTTTTNAWTPLEMGGTLTGYGLSFLVEGTATTPPVTWLTASPLGGTIAPGASETIQVNFDATNLEAGTYNGSLVFASNDVANPTVTVPVTLNVEPSSICYPAPRNLTSTVAAQTVTLNWSAPNFGGGGGGGTVKLEEGFEGATFPPTGWAKLNPDNGTGWTSLLAGTTPIPGWTGASVATAAPNGGDKMAFATWNTGGPTANNQWLVTPQITVEAGDKLAFHMRYAFDSYADNVDIRISTASQNNPADFSTVVAALTFSTGSSTDWVLYEYNLTDFVAPGTPIYIGFREHVADNFNDGSAIMIDNVYVGPAPTLAAVAPSIGTVSAQRDYSYAVNTVPQIAGSVGVSELDANASTGAVVPGGVKYNTGNTRSEILFDNGPFVNAPGAGPGGSDLSQLHSGMTTFGPSINHAGSIRVADDFTVTDTWNVESFTFYAYQTATHPNPPVSSITGAYMKIWSGMPDAAGSVVVYGDMTVNALTSTAWTNAYRVSATTPTNTQRPIMSIVCATPGLTLQPGTYYVEWSATGSIASGPWGVPVTINGETNTGNTLQFTTTTNAWVPLEMGGTLTGYGLSFLIEGTEAGGGGCTHGEHLGYNVYRNGTLIGNTVPSVRTFVDSNVPAGTHTYGVTAVYGAPYPGESDMITTEVTVVAPPAITLNPTSIYQYFLAVGNTATKQVNIANTGLSPLTWTATIQYTNESNAMPVPVPEGGATLQGTLDMSVVSSNGGEPQGEERSMVTLSYDGPNATGIGLTNGGTFSLAARYPSSMTTPYAGYKLKQVEIYINELPTSAVLKVWGAGTTGSPGTLLREQNLTVVQGWNTINLTNQLTLDGTDLWVGYTVTHAAGAFPAGMDAGPANANGDFISTDGTSWNKLSVIATTINRNWNIKAKLEPGVTYTWLMMSPPMSGTIAPGASTNRTLVLNSAGLTPARYTANVLFASNDPANPVKALPVVMDVVIGVNETDMSAINVYPVPAHSYLNLQLVEGIRLVRMFNYMGQVVFERSINGELSTTLNLDGMRSGAYTLQFISAEGKTYSRTVIINR